MNHVRSDGGNESSTVGSSRVVDLGGGGDGRRRLRREGSSLREGLDSQAEERLMDRIEK